MNKVAQTPPKIVVCFTSKEFYDCAKDPRRGNVPMREWVAICIRGKLSAAGIPLRLTFSPLSDLQVTSGRLEWWEDLRNHEGTVFEWYENEEPK